MAFNTVDTIAVAVTAGELLGTFVEPEKVPLAAELMPRLYKLVNICEYCGYWERVEDLSELCGLRICSDCLEMEVHQD